LIRAVIEGVSYSQKDCLDVVAELGAPATAVRASGGGARSALWRQVLADVLGRRIVRLETQEGSAYGAALLAMVGTGAFASVPEACRASVREVDSVAPHPAETEAYARDHAVYRALYPALRAVPGLMSQEK
jgi:xylulokinase